ncbi:hypothetical protein KC19_VG158300 [Ceratodon purpureus]|uniref:Uncharacterized protein n=1 Tax=Ceratodon purpureus TaxID=3225 RepID=A0A8T0HR07_CERPU|nr:hypothetical protein KC19_VG158300 [Ceratodon purpureus]
MPSCILFLVCVDFLYEVKCVCCSGIIQCRWASKWSVVCRFSCLDELVLLAT